MEDVSRKDQMGLHPTASAEGTDVQNTSTIKRLCALLVLLSICLCMMGFENAKNLYLVPIGDVPASEIDGLVAHYRQKFGIEIQILPRIAASPGDFDQKRQQLIAESVIQTMLRDYPNYANDGSAVLIGLTSQDMYPLGANFRFCFGWRLAGSRSAVVSSARMNLHYWGEPPPAEVTLENRLQKMVTRDIGVLYYGMSLNNNPRSVLYNEIGGIQELDRATEDFTPSGATGIGRLSQFSNLQVFVFVGIAAGIVYAAAIKLLSQFTGGEPGYTHVDGTAVPPADQTRERYTAAWQDRRRRFFVFKAVQVSFFALLLGLFVVTRKQPHVSSRMVLLVFGAWFFSYIAVGLWLNRFRCPRCGKLYYWRWDLKGSMERQRRWRDCRWCGLHQDEEPAPNGATILGSR